MKTITKMGAAAFAASALVAVHTFVPPESYKSLKHPPVCEWDHSAFIGLSPVTAHHPE